MLTQLPMILLSPCSQIFNFLVMYSEVLRKLGLLFDDFLIEFLLILNGFFMNLFQSFDFLAELILYDLILVFQLQQTFIDFHDLLLDTLDLCLCQRFFFMYYACLKHLRNTQQQRFSHYFSVIFIYQLNDRLLRIQFRYFRFKHHMLQV